jgi:hypothetical protein
LSRFAPVQFVQIVQAVQNILNPNSAVAVAAKSEEQTFHSEAMPFGIANGKSQIPKIWNLQSAI